MREVQQRPRRCVSGCGQQGRAELDGPGVLLGAVGELESRTQQLAVPPHPAERRRHPRRGIFEQIHAMRQVQHARDAVFGQSDGRQDGARGLAVAGTACRLHAIERNQHVLGKWLGLAAHDVRRQCGVLGGRRSRRQGAGHARLTAREQPLHDDPDIAVLRSRHTREGRLIVLRQRADGAIDTLDTLAGVEQIRGSQQQAQGQQTGGPAAAHRAQRSMSDRVDSRGQFIAQAASTQGAGCSVRPRAHSHRQSKEGHAPG